MRYLFITGTLTIVLASGVVFIQSGDAFGQQPSGGYVPVQRTYTTPFTTQTYWKYREVEEESDETAKLNALDAQLGQQAESLGKQLADAGDEKDRAKLKESLEETLTQQFDTQQKVRELEVASIEARVKKLRDVIAKRNEARRTIIDKRLDQLIREAEGLGWNSPSGSFIGNVPQTSGVFFSNQVGSADAQGARPRSVPMARPRAK